MKSFVDLYNYLCKSKFSNIREWLEDDDKWVGKEKQESLLRLFGGLGLINKLRDYKICIGNMNLGTLNEIKNKREIFYDKKSNKINLNDKGDASDLSGINIINKNNYLLTTSKNLKKILLNKLDIDKLIVNFEKNYKSKTYTLCVMINSKSKLLKALDNCDKTSETIKELILDKNTIIMDWKDLNESYHKFLSIYKHIKIKNLLNVEKEPLILKMHQEFSVERTMYLKKKNKKRILWGHIPRSGKSYIMAGTIIKDIKNKKNSNYLILTTAPNETIEQYMNVLNCLQLSKMNVIYLNGKNKEPELSDNNIIICSKQFLQGKTEKVKIIKWLKEMSFDIRFLDESHNGGTTELAKKVLDNYGSNSFTVQITATYSKPINDYDIPEHSQILWDLEDVQLCKNIDKKDNIQKLCSKMGKKSIKNILSKYSIEELKKDYGKYPEFNILTDKINDEKLKELVIKTSDNNYGWSPESVFLLKDDKFQNEKENLKMWYRIFGCRDEYGIPDKEYPEDQVFMDRIMRMCKRTNSRYIGGLNEPLVVMAFLPTDNIDKISQATKKLLEKNKVIENYEIVIINSKVSSNPRKEIDNGYIRALSNKKEGVLVLSGRQCSLGVSIKKCDVVLLLNNYSGYDILYQMMFRAMTEDENKRKGFVVDLNIHRVIETSLINYAGIIKPDLHPREAIKYILEERILNLNCDHWEAEYGKNNLLGLSKSVYEIYSSNTEKALKHFLDRLSFKQVLLTKEHQEIFNVMFTNGKPTKEQVDIIKKLIDDETLKKGIEKIEIEGIEDIKSEELEKDDKKDKKDVKYMELLKHIIPLVCLLTIHDKESSFVEMYNLIEKNPNILKILLDQTRSWWGKNIDLSILKIFINIYMNIVKNDKETKQIIRTVKELFSKNVNNNKELSKLIDKYLIPQELEKKANAEVSTPYKLRNEMLDKMPDNFWKKSRKVFEPCSGKGGFLIDIVDRFMEGLKDKIPDDKMRYKHIVEECLYFSDINATNIFVNKLLLDPNNKYKLNYNEGNTLELDIKEKWGLEGFDAVIGNPPYEICGASGDNKGYLLFTKFSINIIKKGYYLLFITPPNILEYLLRFKFKNRNYIENFYDIKYIAIQTPNKYFSVGSKFCYFLLKNDIVKKSKTKTEYLINDKIDKSVVNLVPNINYPFNIFNKLTIDILNKFDKKEKFDIKNMTYNDKKINFRIRKKQINEGKVVEKKSKDKSYLIIDKINKTYPDGKKYYTNIKLKDYNNLKIIFSKVGYLCPYLIKEGNISDNLLYMLINNKKEYDYLVSILESKIFSFICKTTLLSGMDYWKILMLLPKIPLIKKYTDEELFKILKLNEKEINYINSFFKKESL